MDTVHRCSPLDGREARLTFLMVSASTPHRLPQSGSTSDEDFFFYLIRLGLLRLGVTCLFGTSEVPTGGRGRPGQTSGSVELYSMKQS